MQNIEDDRNNNLTQPPVSTEEQIKKLMVQNLQLTREIHEMTRRINGYVTFQKIMSIMWLVLIVAPIIWSVFYLPPLLKGIMDQYSGIMGSQSGIESLLNSVPGITGAAK